MGSGLPKVVKKGIGVQRFIGSGFKVQRLAVQELGFQKPERRGRNSEGR